MPGKLCSISQRYNSKAIHNRRVVIVCCRRVVLNLSKIQFKSNSQRGLSGCITSSGCAQSLKDTIQKQFTTMYETHNRLSLLCSISQRYNSKAIHNSLLRRPRQGCVVLNLSKIQFKSNSQQRTAHKVYLASCAQSLKDTIQKQFTTMVSTSA